MRSSYMSYLSYFEQFHDMVSAIPDIVSHCRNFYDRRPDIQNHDYVCGIPVSNRRIDFDIPLKDFYTTTYVS